MKKIEQINEPFEPEEREKIISGVVDELCREESYKTVYHRVNHQDVAMPSTEVLTEVMELLKSVLFPGYFINSEITPGNMKYHTGSTLDRIMRVFSEQIKRGFCFFCSGDDEQECHDCERRAERITLQFLERLPFIRERLATDARAAFDGDPAAQKIGETIFCYPSIRALTHHRIAHELYRLEVPLIPRMISEMAHSQTGIDIHPGAEIGERFFMDHGTGIVIGETCVIGRNVRLYQGVTLGAKSFPLDEEGNPLKGIPRHPIVEDDVVIYAGATILGRVTVGHGAEIGGNLWVTGDVEAGARLVQHKAEYTLFKKGEGL